MATLSSCLNVEMQLHLYLHCVTLILMHDLMIQIIFPTTCWLLGVRIWNMCILF